MTSWEELMPIAWHPTRILEWCLDVEELEYLKERWGISLVIVEYTFVTRLTLQM